jgi:hypothetical protein
MIKKFWTDTCYKALRLNNVAQHKSHMTTKQIQKLKPEIKLGHIKVSRKNQTRLLEDQCLIFTNKIFGVIAERIWRVAKLSAVCQRKKRGACNVLLCLVYN